MVSHDPRPDYTPPVSTGSEETAQATDARICPQDGSVCWDSCTGEYCKGFVDGHACRHTPEERHAARETAKRLLSIGEDLSRSGYAIDRARRIALEDAAHLLRALVDAPPASSPTPKGDR